MKINHSKTNKPMKTETALHLIVKHAIESQMTRKRDMTSKGSPVFGDKSEQANAVLIVVESDIEQMYKEFKAGKDIYEIIPGLVHETKYDEQT